MGFPEDEAQYPQSVMLTSASACNVDVLLGICLLFKKRVKATFKGYCATASSSCPAGCDASCSMIFLNYVNKNQKIEFHLESIAGDWFGSEEVEPNCNST